MEVPGWYENCAGVLLPLPERVLGDAAAVVEVSGWYENCAVVVPWLPAVVVRDAAAVLDCVAWAVVVVLPSLGRVTAAPLGCVSAMVVPAEVLLGSTTTEVSAMDATLESGAVVLFEKEDCAKTACVLESVRAKRETRVSGWGAMTAN